MKAKVILVCVLLCVVAGCVEEFSAGVGVGMVASENLLSDTQDKFIEAVNTMNAETAEINAKIEAVKSIEVSDFIKPEAIEAGEKLKGRAKDPVTWLALASLLGNAFWGGRTFEKKKGS